MYKYCFDELIEWVARHAFHNRKVEKGLIDKKVLTAVKPKPHILSATRRWHRSDRTFHFLWLFSGSYRPKITHLFLKDFVKTKTIVHQMQSTQYLISFSDENSTGRMPM
jgi:hypothetical protein